MSRREKFVLVSVIIPVFNGERYLTECLESVKACMSPEIECIVVNDGSTDGTQEISQRFVSADTRFRLINKENSGVSESRNLGMAEASGNYIFFLDADDYINTEQWSEILLHAGRNAYDLVAYGYYNLFDSGSVKAEQFPENCDIKLALLSTTMLNTCWGTLLRRELIIKTGLRFRKELKTCEDAIFMLDFAQESRNILLSNTYVLFYRIHSGGVTRSTGIENRLADFASLYERRLTYLSDNFDEDSRIAMYRQFFSVVTDFFRSYTENRRIIEIRLEYKKNLKNPTVAAIIGETKMGFLTYSYKKLEYLLMSCGFCACLAIYFKIKGRLRPSA